MTALATDTTLAELLAACRSPAGRDCDTTHLVLADRLEELGRGEWAELVRVSVELGRVGPPHKQTHYPEQPTSLSKNGDKHYSFIGYVDENFQIGDRVDLLVHRPLKKSKKVYGFRIYKIEPYEEEYDSRELKVYVRIDSESKPWAGDALRSRQRELETRLRMGAKCERCENGTAESLFSGPTPNRLKPCPHCHGTGHTGTLSRKGGSCSDCQGTGSHRYYPDLNGEPNYSDSAPCSRCKGTGINSNWSIPVVWSRGLPVRLTAPLASLYDVAADRPSEWAISVQREWCGSVTEMVAGDQEPYKLMNLWYIPFLDEPHPRLWKRFGADPTSGNRGRESPELATADFARALADLAREG